MPIQRCIPAASIDSQSRVTLWTGTRKSRVAISGSHYCTRVNVLHRWGITYPIYGVKSTKPHSKNILGLKSTCPHSAFSMQLPMTLFTCIAKFCCGVNEWTITCIAEQGRKEKLCSCTHRKKGREGRRDEHMISECSLIYAKYSYSRKKKITSKFSINSNVSNIYE